MRAAALLLTLVQATTPVASPAPSPGGAASTPQVVGETRVDSLTKQIAAQLRCPVCQGLSLQDSPSELAQEMRNVIREKVTAGESPRQIKAYFVSKYGEFILLAPEARGFNLAVYLLPIVSVLIGAGVITFAVRRWMASTPPGGPVPGNKSEVEPEFEPWEDTAGERRD